MEKGEPWSQAAGLASNLSSLTGTDLICNTVFCLFGPQVFFFFFICEVRTITEPLSQIRNEV